MAGGHCPKCWSGVPADPGGLCRACYSWYQDWLLRRLPGQKAALEEWRSERARWPRWRDGPGAGGAVTPRRPPDPDPPAWRGPPGPLLPPPEWIPRPTRGRADPCYFTDPGPAWDNAVRAYEEDR